MRLIDTLTSNERETLVLKGMLAERTGSAQSQTIETKHMPNTITLRKRIKDADKKHSVIFSTELSAEADKEIVDSIYFKRPFADGVKEIKLTIVRNTDNVVENL
jgi:hypothetical protein